MGNLGQWSQWRGASASVHWLLHTERRSRGIEEKAQISLREPKSAKEYPRKYNKVLRTFRSVKVSKR